MSYETIDEEKAKAMGYLELTEEVAERAEDSALHKMFFERNKVLLDELQSLAKQDTSALTQYNYYSILFAWYMSHEAREQAEEAGQ